MNAPTFTHYAGQPSQDEARHDGSIPAKTKGGQLPGGPLDARHFAAVRCAMRNARLSPWSIAGCFLLVIGAVAAALLTDYRLKKRGPLWEKFLQVQPGMTMTEVEAILGPADNDSLERPYFSSSWQEDGREIDVSYTWSDDPPTDSAYVVASKRFEPKSLAERLFDWCRDVGK
jgi:hypothetical protein